MEQRYTTKEAAKIIGMSYCYFMRKVKAGEYQCHKLGERKTFFTESDLQNIIDNSLVKPKTETKE